jgi:hypothetical protein
MKRGSNLGLTLVTVIAALGCSERGERGSMSDSASSASSSGSAGGSSSVAGATTSGTTTGSGATGGTGGLPGADIDCDSLSLPLTALAVGPTEVEGLSPEPQGGALSDGVYDFVEWRVYGPLTEDGQQDSLQHTIRIFSGGTRYESVLESASGLARRAGAFEVQGTMLYSTRACPPSTQSTREGGWFTASGVEILTFPGTNPGENSEVFVLRRR